MPRILNEHLQTLARVSLLLAGVGLHYHRDRLAAGLRRHRPHRRHRQSQFVPELATGATEAASAVPSGGGPAATGAPASPASPAAPAATAVTAILPTQDRQPIEGDVVDVATIAPRPLRHGRRRAGQALEDDDDRPRGQRRQLLQRRSDARVRPVVLQGCRTEHDDDASGRVGVWTDLEVPCAQQIPSGNFHVE